MDKTIAVKRKRKRITRDPSRVITRMHLPHRTARTRRIIKRVLGLDDSQAAFVLKKVYTDFSDRHRDVENIFRRHFEAVSRFVPPNTILTDDKKKLIGAFFTMEYAIESAAIFNPSMVPHPDQSAVDNGQVRFIMSLRATGEGHISSIEFRSGTIDQDTNIVFDPLSDFVESAQMQLNPLYDRYLFQLKLNEMRACNETTTYLLSGLPEQFSFNQLQERIDAFEQENKSPNKSQDDAIEIVQWLARSNYVLKFDSDSPLSERVIFPASENDRSGIEDARFVRFVDDNGEATYYATYTAYNGYTILPQMIETKDFITFKIITLNGKAVQNKGMALFPRKINGNYIMLSRQDNENNHIMFSDHLHFWQKADIIQRPAHPWEFVQIGNCGSPIETDEGWLVLTHGVGPMREYCISAVLLDLDNPSKLIGTLETPLMEPRDEEREGYVPNVVYTCGAMISNGELIIPYAMSDTSSGIATVSVDDLIAGMSRQ